MSYISSMINESPESKRKKINTLYEAVALFQLSKFIDCIDIDYHENNKKKWEVYKPGDLSVITNRGCCSSSASWLYYLLENRYDEIGYLSFVFEDGNGHILNYIKHEGYIYFVDLMTHNSRYIDNQCVENGDRISYVKSGMITGVFMKANSYHNYINYILRYTKRKSKSICFFLSKGMQPISISFDFKPNPTIFLSRQPEDYWIFNINSNSKLKLVVEPFSFTYTLQ